MSQFNLSIIHLSIQMSKRFKGILLLPVDCSEGPRRNNQMKKRDRTLRKY